MAKIGEISEGVSRIKTFAWIFILTVASSASLRSETFEPDSGILIGISSPLPESLDPSFPAALGFDPAVYSLFVKFPLNEGGREEMDQLVRWNALLGVISLITLEPTLGLESVTEAEMDLFVDRCVGYEAAGAKLMVRFGHEMNGSWYAWGQKPTLYVQKFRELANKLKAATRRTALLWAPSNGIGYPFGSGPVLPDPALDTNEDGQFTSADDPYSPYYPGDDVVDWVGMSIYSWGNYSNEVPADRLFADSLTGYNGAAAPNFYQIYCAGPDHGKPMAVPETAAFFEPGAGGDGELEIKRKWWRQVFNTFSSDANAADLITDFPQLKMVVYFNYEKIEAGVPGDPLVDWRLTGTGNEALNAQFQEFMAESRTIANGLLERDYLTASYPYVGILGAPALISHGAGTHAVTLLVSSPDEDADLFLNLLDQTFSFVSGSGAISVQAGTRNETRTVSVPSSALVPSSRFYWNGLLTPSGEVFPNTIYASPLIATATTADPGADRAEKIRIKLEKELARLKKALAKAKKIRDRAKAASTARRIKNKMRAIKKKLSRL